MGLLDVFNTEEGRLGLGLLAAAAPRSDGANFGQRLSEGVGSVDAWKKQALERDLLKAQAAENLAQIEARKQAAIRDKQLQDLIESRFGGGSSSALQQGAAVGDVGPTVTNAARMNQGMGSMTLDDIALLKLRGKDLTDVYKLGQPNWQNVNGNMVNTNTPSFKGGFIPGMQISSNGQASLTTVGPDGLPRISSPPGALDTYAGYQDAEKKAAARYDVTSYTPAGATNPIQSTRLQDVQRVTAQAPKQAGVVNQGNANLSPELIDFIMKDASSRGGPTPTINVNAPKAGQTMGLESKQSGNLLQSEPEKAAALGKVENVTKSQNQINETWLKTSYEPIIANESAAQSLIDSSQVARQAMKDMGGTGWSTEFKAAGANILTGLGVAPKSAEMYASNAQIFQKTAMDRLWTTLNAAKGPQTEGDAQRAAKTFASLGNTTRANEFILDLSQAQAERDKAKARFYKSALPVAQKTGDLSEVDREWQARSPSIFSMPSMKKWGQK